MSKYVLVLMLLSLSFAASTQTVSFDSLRLAEAVINASLQAGEQVFAQADQIAAKQGVTNKASRMLSDEIVNVGIRTRAASYTEKLTEEQIKQALSFFKTEAGQKFLRVEAEDSIAPGDQASDMKEACAAAAQRLGPGPDRASLMNYSACKN